PSGNEWTVFWVQNPMRFGCTEKPISQKTPTIPYAHGLCVFGIRIDHLIITGANNLFYLANFKQIVTTQRIHAFDKFGQRISDNEIGAVVFEVLDRTGGRLAKTAPQQQLKVTVGNIRILFRS